MKTVAALTLLACSTVAVGQSPLATMFAGTNQAWPGSQFFFDLTVSTTVTIQAIECNLSSAPGVEGTIQVFTTNSGVTTYYGNEQNAAQWSALPVATGSIKAAGANLPSYCCLSPGLVLPPGTTGIALRHVNVQPWYTQGNGSPIPGGGGPGTNQTYSTAELTLLSGAVQNVPWNAPAAPRAWNGTIHYALGAALHACAKNEDYGPAGCYQQQASFYQFFSSAAAASAALSGRSISLINTNPGYIVVGNAPGVAFVAPSGAATTVPPVDDGEQTYAWPSATPFSTSGATSFAVHSNGIVSLAGIGVLTPSSYRPNVPGFLNAGADAWYCWHDYNPTAGGSGVIKGEEIAGVVYLTWDGVESYPSAVVNPSRWQFQFHLASGNVNYVWQTITALGDAAYGDSHLIGYSPAGSNLDPRGTDLATLSSLIVGTIDQAPLTLEVVGRPALNSTIDYTTSNVTPSAFPVGLLFLSLADLGPFSPAGFDLGVIGAGGCVANIDPNLAPIQAAIFAPGGLTFSLSIPYDVSYLGNLWYAQSIWLDATVNSFGMLTSNAIRQTVGTF
jgi:hypothetical protein